MIWPRLAQDVPDTADRTGRETDLQFAPEGEEDITINCCVGGEAVDFSVGAACNCGLLSHFIFRGISFDGGIRRKEAFALNGVVKYLQALSFRGTRIGCWWLCPTLFLCCRCRSKAKCRLLSLLLFITHLLQVFKCSLSVSTPRLFNSRRGGACLASSFEAHREPKSSTGEHREREREVSRTKSQLTPAFRIAGQLLHE